MVPIKYNYVVDKQNRMKEMEETPKIIQKAKAMKGGSSGGTGSGLGQNVATE